MTSMASMPTRRALKEFWRTAGDLVSAGLRALRRVLVEGGRRRHLCAPCDALVAIVEPPCCRTCGLPFYGEVRGGRCAPTARSSNPRSGRGGPAFCSRVRALARARAQIPPGAACAGGHGRAHPGRPRAWPTTFAGPCWCRCRCIPGRSANAVQPESAAGASSLRPRAVRERGSRSPCGASWTRRRRRRLDRRTRQANLKNAFALRKGADINPAERYVLIDDVFTTGSTLNACAVVLRRAGGVNLDVVTFGHG